MSAMIGADPDEMCRVARELATAAGEISKIRRLLTTQIHAAPWQGGNAARFRQQWDGEYRSAINSSVAFLEDASAELNRNADEQRRASSARGYMRLDGYQSHIGSNGFSGGDLFDLIKSSHEIADYLKTIADAGKAASGAIGILGGVGALFGFIDIVYDHPYGPSGVFSILETASDWMQFAGGLMIPLALGASLFTPAGVVIIGAGVILFGVGKGIDIGLKFWNDDGGREMWSGGSRAVNRGWRSATETLSRTWDDSYQSRQSEWKAVAGWL